MHVLPVSVFLMSWKYTASRHKANHGEISANSGSVVDDSCGLARPLATG